MKRKLNGLFLFIIGLLYIIILVSLIAVIVYKRLPLLNVLLLSLITYGIINILFSSRMVIRIFFGFSLVISCFITYACWANNPVFKPILQVTEGVLALWHSIYYNISYSSEQITLYANITLLLTALLASLLVIILLKRFQSFYILSVIVLLMFLFSWYMSAKETRFLFAVYLVLTILSYINKVYLRKRKLGLASDDLQTGSLMFFNIPIAIIIVLIIFMIPKSSQPIQWAWMDKKINDAYIFLEQRFVTQKMEYFSLTSTGFGNEKNNRLGGPIRPRYNEVMKVKADKRTYLRGAAYSWYENNTWTRSNQQSSSAIMNDLNEIQKGWSNIPIDRVFPDISDDDALFLEDLAQGRLNDILFPVYSTEIEIRNLITNNLFIPLKTIMPIKSNDNIMPTYELVDGIAMSLDTIRRGSSYKIDYIQPMYGEELYKKALSFSRKNLYKESIAFWETKHSYYHYLQLINGADDSADKKGTDEITKQLNESDEIISSLKALYSETLQIEETYVKLPDNIPQRVKDLAFSLTQNLNSDYEKVIAVEKYLRDNYTYTLNPREVPYDRDFVDYFLFEEKEGYCTYYATSMAVLLRLSGIPARYVEGYVLPPEASSDNIYTVTNMNAHAWVEVYFEGFGWLVFEPTTVYAGTMDYKTVSDYIDYSSYSSYEEMMERFRSQDEIIGYTPIKNEYEIESESNYLLIFLYILVGLIIVGILINLLATLISVLILKASSNEKRILLLYKKIVVWLFHIGYKFKIGETAREFAARIDEVYYFPEHNFKEITEIFSKVRYGGHKISSDEYKTVKDLCDILNKKVIKELGVRRFIPLRRIFLGI